MTHCSELAQAATVNVPENNRDLVEQAANETERAIKFVQAIDAYGRPIFVRAEMNTEPKRVRLYELVGKGIVQISKSLDSPCFWTTIEQQPLDESRVLITQINNSTFSATGDLEVYSHKKA